MALLSSSSMAATSSDVDPFEPPAGYGTSDETGSYSYSYVSVEVLADGTEVERHAYMRQASHHSSTTSSDGRHPGRPHLHRGKGDRDRHRRSAHGKRLSSSVTKVDLGPLHLDTNEEFADDREARRRRRADRQRLKRGREGLQMEGTRALERSLADERRMGAPLVNRTFAGASVSSNSDGKGAHTRIRPLGHRTQSLLQRFGLVWYGLWLFGSLALIVLSIIQLNVFGALVGVLTSGAASLLAYSIVNRAWAGKKGLKGCLHIGLDWTALITIFLLGVRIVVWTGAPDFGGFPNACPDSPNCTRVTATGNVRGEGLIPPIVGAAAADVMAFVVAWLADYESTSVIEETASFLHVRSTTSFVGYPDDVFVLLDCANGTMTRLQVQSMSRIGNGDANKNDHRVRALLEAVGSADWDLAPCGLADP